MDVDVDDDDGVECRPSSGNQEIALDCYSMSDIALLHIFFPFLSFHVPFFFLVFSCSLCSVFTFGQKSLGINHRTFIFLFCWFITYYIININNASLANMVYFSWQVASAGETWLFLCQKFGGR